MILCNDNSDRHLSDDRKSWDYWAMFTQAYADSKTGVLSVIKDIENFFFLLFLNKLSV